MIVSRLTAASMAVVKRLQLLIRRVGKQLPASFADNIGFVPLPRKHGCRNLYKSGPIIFSDSYYAATCKKIAEALHRTQLRCQLDIAAVRYLAHTYLHGRSSSSDIMAA